MANTLRGRSTPPTKTTRAKHTRKTTPTSPSWRFTNEPSRLVTSGGVRRHTEPFRRLVQAGALTGIWPGSPSRRWGIELTEGQPDTRQTKQTKEIPNYEELIAVAGLGTAVALGSLVGAGTASAENFTICPSGLSGVSTADTSCAFADNVRRAWYSQPGTIVTAYSPVTGLAYDAVHLNGYHLLVRSKAVVGMNGYGRRPDRLRRLGRSWCCVDYAPTYDLPYRYQQDFKAAENDARAQERRLW